MPVFPEAAFMMRSLQPAPATQRFRHYSLSTKRTSHPSQLLVSQLRSPEGDTATFLTTIDALTFVQIHAGIAVTKPARMAIRPPSTGFHSVVLLRWGSP